MISTDLKVMSVADLLAHFENDVRYGCHSTRAEASRSLAGKELETRGEDAVQALTARQNEMSQQSQENGVEAGVRCGIEMLLSWMAEATSKPAMTSGILVVSQQIGLSR